jgi:uncharacterized protein YcbX
VTERRVHELAIAVLKGGRLTHPEAVDVGPRGIADDRRFFVVAENGRQLDARRGPLTAVAPVWDGDARRLALRLPDDVVVENVVALGERVDGLVAWDANRPVGGREVLGPFSAALSRHLGQPVRLVERLDDETAVDVAPLTIVSTASVALLEANMGVDGLGSRRFRMTLTLAGCAAHEEDGWLGRVLQMGGCRLIVGGPVPRCVAVTHDPVTGERDHGVLKGIVGYRPRATAPGGARVAAPFGVYAEVDRPGRIALGDRVVVRAADLRGGPTAGEEWV